MVVQVSISDHLETLAVTDGCTTKLSHVIHMVSGRQNRGASHASNSIHEIRLHVLYDNDLMLMQVLLRLS
jgi:hypothetical protein|tara:strand:- start:1817 stop:2026 length:210 start_codon:yes stop_codon:yes gene_type:complete